jgi:hypothetical protein
MTSIEHFVGGFENCITKNVKHTALPASVAQLAIASCIDGAGSPSRIIVARRYKLSHDLAPSLEPKCPPCTMIAEFAPSLGLLDTEVAES